MRIFSTIFILLFFLLVTDSSYSQQWRRDRHHVILGLGGSGFMGDLGGADDYDKYRIQDLDFQAVKPSVMLGYRYFIFENLSARGNLIYTQVVGDDKYTDEPYRNNRNIHFRSPIAEFSVQGEYYFFQAERTGAIYRRITRSRGWVGYNISAYAFAGIGGFYFNPQAKFNSEDYNGTIPDEDLPPDGWYDLRPLRTEGQGYYPTREVYSKYEISVPLGIGALFKINDEFSVGIEYGFRKTWTNYIDDVGSTYVDPAIYHEMWPDDPQRIALAEHFSNPSKNNKPHNVTAPGQQRGGSYFNDSYMFTFITAYYRIPTISPSRSTPRF